jgi:hypothetical protein
MMGGPHQTFTQHDVATGTTYTRAEDAAPGLRHVVELTTYANGDTTVVATTATGRDWTEHRTETRQGQITWESTRRYDADTGTLRSRREWTDQAGERHAEEMTGHVPHLGSPVEGLGAGVR